MAPRRPARKLKLIQTPDVTSWSAQLTDNYLMCRDFGHNWKSWRASYSKKEHRYQRVLRCSRCKTERVQYISESGLIEQGHYNYPDGYQAPKGTGHLTGTDRGALRLETLTRVIGAEQAPRTKRA